jgi:hypothetical protein
MADVLVFFLSSLDGVRFSSAASMGIMISWWPVI